MAIKFTAHALRQMQSRNISPHLAEMILVYGTQEKRPGGALLSRISKDMLERAQKVEVKWNPDTGEVITVEFDTRRKKRI